MGEAMANIVVSVINDSNKVVSDDDCRALVAALQVQVSRDFAPVWGTDATLEFVPAGGTPRPGTWWLSILDTTDRPGVLGHHDVTPEGLPVGKSFAGTDKQYHHCWTVTASHELLEMLVDPDINLTVYVHPEHGKNLLYAFEVCDACQDDRFSYEIDGVKVCDFVYPAYFQTFRQPGGAQFDHLGKVEKPVPEVLAGGYITAYDVNGTSGWEPHTGATLDEDAKRALLRGDSSSRRERRQRPRSQWVTAAELKTAP
jgi:hypothetical protein